VVPEVAVTDEGTPAVEATPTGEAADDQNTTSASN